MPGRFGGRHIIFAKGQLRCFIKARLRVLAPGPDADPDETQEAHDCDQDSEVIQFHSARSDGLLEIGQCGAQTLQIGDQGIHLGLAL